MPRYAAEPSSGQAAVRGNGRIRRGAVSPRLLTALIVACAALITVLSPLAWLSRRDGDLGRGIAVLLALGALFTALDALVFLRLSPRSWPRLRAG